MTGPDTRDIPVPTPSPEVSAYADLQDACSVLALRLVDCRDATIRLRATMGTIDSAIGRVDRQMLREDMDRTYDALAEMEEALDRLEHRPEPMYRLTPKGRAVVETARGLDISEAPSGRSPRPLVAHLEGDYETGPDAVDAMETGGQRDDIGAGCGYTVLDDSGPGDAHGSESDGESS